jgi:ABC-type uncharacterized transport system substrate-binding protein
LLHLLTAACTNANCRCAPPRRLTEAKQTQCGGLITAGFLGANPVDLPVLQVTKFEFVINLRTAKTVGVPVSDNLLSLADEVIE